LLTQDGSWEPQSGVTSVTKRSVDKSEVLIAWAKKVCLEKLRLLLLDQYIAPEGLIQLYEEELEQIIREAKRANDDVLEAAGATGHIAHSWVESWIKACLGQGNKDWLLDHMPEDPRANKCCAASLLFMIAHDVKWISTERKVYSRRYKYAGTLDGLAYVSSCNDPTCCTEVFKDRLSIMDWKTSNGLYLEYLLQTAAYQNAIEEEDKVDILDRWVIRLGKEDGEFDPWHAAGRASFLQDFEAFLKTLEMTKAVRVVEDRLSDIKGIKKATRLAKEKAEREARDKIACPKSSDYKGSRVSKCLSDGSQCVACRLKYTEKHPK